MVDDSGIEASHTRLHILPGVRHDIAFDIALHILVIAIAGVDNLHRSLIHHCTTCVGIFSDKFPGHAIVPCVAVHYHIFALAIFGKVEEGCLLHFAGAHIAIGNIGIDGQIRGGT